MNRRRLVAGTATMALAGLFWSLQTLPASSPTVAKAEASRLVPYSGCTELRTHYRDALMAGATAEGLATGSGMDGPMAMSLSASSAVGGAEATSADSSANLATTDGGGDSGAQLSQNAAVGSGPTGTNLQEQGVDEADRVKLKDGRLLMVTGKGLRIVSAEAQPRALGSLRLTTAYDGPLELLVVGDRVLVVSASYRESPAGGATPKVGSARTRGFTQPARIMTPVTALDLVDVSSDTPRLVERVRYDGAYVSSRLIGGTVRVVTRSEPRVASAYPDGMGTVSFRASLEANRAAARTVTEADLLPQVERLASDGTVVESGPAVDCAQVQRPTDARGSSTLLVTTMRPASGLDATDSTAVRTAGDVVYASTDRLYLATGPWQFGFGFGIGDGVVGSDATGVQPTTEIHAFDTTTAGATRYVATGSVPGQVLGRWALSENEGVLRVATTRRDENGQPRDSIVAKLVERGDELLENGRVVGLGPTEEIKAVRYFGDLATVVTFRETDPLYVVDLADAPRVLGELKIPGFSTYLHPIGDDRLVAVGYDATARGRITGVQVSVFDLSDRSAPKQVSRRSLGDGYSPALEDSRAFTYDPQRRTAYFGFSSYSRDRGDESGVVAITIGADGALAEPRKRQTAKYQTPDRVLVDGELLFAITGPEVVAADASTLTITGRNPG